MRQSPLTLPQQWHSTLWRSLHLDIFMSQRPQNLISEKHCGQYTCTPSRGLENWGSFQRLIKIQNQVDIGLLYNRRECAIVWQTMEEQRAGEMTPDVTYRHVVCNVRSRCDLGKTLEQHKFCSHIRWLRVMPLTHKGTVS